MKCQLFRRFVLATRRNDPKLIRPKLVVIPRLTNAFDQPLIYAGFDARPNALAEYYQGGFISS